VLDALIELVSASPATYGLVLALVAADAIAPLIPSEAVVLAATVLAAEGELLIWLVYPAVVLGALLGDNITYWLGDRVGEPTARRLLGGDKAQRRVARARQVIDCHGTTLIVALRFCPGGRTATSLAAGTLDFPWRRFLAADAAAVLLSATYVVGVGYFAGRTFESVWQVALLTLGAALISILGALAVRRVRIANPGFSHEIRRA